jgi:hypothetical protein
MVSSVIWFLCFGGCKTTSFCSAVIFLLKNRSAGWRFSKAGVAGRFMLMDSKDLMYASDFLPLLTEA